MEILPETSMQWMGALLALLVAIGVAWNRYRAGTDKADDRLISLLKDEVETLSRKVDSLEERLAVIQSERDAYYKAVTGADDKTITFRETMKESAAMGKQNNKLLHQLVKSTNSLNEALTQHLKEIS